MVDSDLGYFVYQGSPYMQTIQWQEEEWRTRKERSEEERHRKRQEECNASLSANAPYGHNAYAKLPGKKWKNPLLETNSTVVTFCCSYVHLTTIRIDASWRLQ